MLIGRNLIFILFIHSVNLEIQINFHLTNWEIETNDIQHDCLNVAARVEEGYGLRQIISYCISEWPSKFHIVENNFHEKFTFSQLAKQHITSTQLYHWSASIDLIEEYQYYLNQFPYVDENLSKKVFYNCTLPYFGSKCQYTFNFSYTNSFSLNDIIYDYYYYNRYQPTKFTCYIHLECDRGPSPSCLDWTEICDGKVDCLNNGIDEQNCLQLLIDDCEANEYKCSYGQCIPKSFVNDGPFSPDCLDQFDEVPPGFLLAFTELRSVTKEPIFSREDISCARFSDMLFNRIGILTSSCVNNREFLLSQALFSTKPNSITNNNCWTALKCIIHMSDMIEDYYDNRETKCLKLCANRVCDEMIAKYCPEIMYIPSNPILHGQVYLAYEKNKLKYSRVTPFGPKYVCFNETYFHLPNDGKTFLLNDNYTCRRYVDAKIGGSAFFDFRWLGQFITPIKKWLHTVKPLIDNNSTIFNQSIMYRCRNSERYIFKTQIMDHTTDCYDNDDESLSIVENNNLMKQINNVFQCPTTNQYIHFLSVNDRRSCDCSIPGDNYCADENSGESYFQKTISFQTICDKIVHLNPEVTQLTNETDETNCEYWPLLHIYNRCDGFWNFLNGSDEIDCDLPFLSLNCSENNHICISRQTNNLICLPIEKANDGIIDCIGAADEPTICHRINLTYTTRIFSCDNNPSLSCIGAQQLCDGKNDCNNKEDEIFCTKNDLIYNDFKLGICSRNYDLEGSIIAKIICRLFSNTGKRSEKYFTFDQSSNPIKYDESLGHVMFNDNDNNLFSDNVHFSQPYCHRGIPLQIWLDKQKNLTKSICLCPPSFYGNICQYQNQRVSVTLQLHVTYDSLKIPFIFIILLININNNNERIIHSYEQINHLFFTKNCQRKFNFYLLYSTRSKNLTKQYSLHIDIYEQITLKYRASFIKSINYSFLPVHRLAFKFHIPHSSNSMNNICSNKDNKCIHGKCIQYFNRKQIFCQCYQGWIGHYCTIKYNSSCSLESLSLGKLENNRSLCVCPLYKIGSRCLINDNICEKETCMNGGTCIRTEIYNTLQKKFTCICSKDFVGDRCEIDRMKLIISFDKYSKNFNSIIFIHFIEIQINQFPIRTTTFKRISVGQNSVIIRWSLPFHLIFIELSNKTYYLMFIQKNLKSKLIIEKRLTLFDRCLNINELFNTTFSNYTLLRRIKYYHLPCQLNLSLLCFYDEQQFCLCQQIKYQRLSNCFNFDHNSGRNCSEFYHCENGGECYQENSDCPQYFLCKCPICYYGERCQLNTYGYSLSLDTILAVFIQPNLKIFNQGNSILISTILSIIISFGGFINGFLLLITFKNKKLCESGCGIYLLNSSILILLIMFIFTMKFWIFILIEIGTITNELFLNIQCHSIDFLLRIFLTMDQWLISFVSIERAFIIIKGINFDKKKTKLIAKYIIFIILLIIILTNIQDLIYRKLDIEINEDDEKRYRCIVNYSSTIRTINYIINIFHFIIPFIINIISASIIIIIKTQQRKVIGKNKQNLRTILNEEIQQHKNLLTGPIVLIILNIPRVVIIFASGCMKSTSDAWLFLFGYFISLIPSTLTFVLFVLPSTVYKEEFRKAINQYRKILQRNS